MTTNFRQNVLQRTGSLSDISILGNTESKDGIASFMGPFTIFPDYKVKYPEIIIKLLGELFEEYNTFFTPLANLNKEWGADYQFTKLSEGPINWMVQIDMVGLPQEVLLSANALNKTRLKKYLRNQIFEIENSIAMYSLLQEVFANENGSQFKHVFRNSLDELRSRYNMPIALLAVTDEKYEAMRSSEFAKTMDDPLSDDEVKNISGFDRFFGPEGFKKHLRSNNGKCKYLLYVRSSDPSRKLKNPNEVVEHPLLSDAVIRQVIKEYSVTINIDNPEWVGSDYRRVNDSKLYMPDMSMGYLILNESFLWNADFNNFISTPRKLYGDYKGEKLSKDFIGFLAARGVNYQDVENGSVELRAKPALATFGCYGHLRGALSDAIFRKELRRLMRQRGGYIIQPEISVHQSMDSKTAEQYSYIDRNFFSITSGKPSFIGGVRNFTPINSFEAIRGRGHGNASSVFAEIIS